MTQTYSLLTQYVGKPWSDFAADMVCFPSGPDSSGEIQRALIGVWRLCVVTWQHFVDTTDSPHLAWTCLFWSSDPYRASAALNRDATATPRLRFEQKETPFYNLKSTDPGL